jgi:hypothetical protein
MDAPLRQDIAGIEPGHAAEGCIAVASREHLLPFGKRLKPLGTRPGQTSDLSDPIELGKGELPGTGKLGDTQFDCMQALSPFWPVLQQESLRRLEKLRSRIGWGPDRRSNADRRIQRCSER